MTLFTENEHETFLSIPTWPCEWPEVVVRDSIAAPELGTYANPIVVGDDLVPLGSASNPIVIHVDEGWCHDEPDQLGSDADTVIMATPEFLGTLTGGNLAVPVDEGATIDSPYVSTPTRSLVSEDPEGLQPFEQSTPDCLHFDDKALKVTEDSFDASQNCSGLETARSENLANDHAETDQSTETGKVFETEELREARGVPETSSITRNAVPQERTDQTGTSLEKGWSCDSFDVRSTKRRLSHEPAANLDGIDCSGKTASAWDSFVSTTIDDELAAIYDHMEHCRNADCLHAKAFFDGIQSPQNMLPNSSDRSKQLQGRSEEGRVTMRFHIPEFQKGATRPIEFLFDQVIIRTAFFSPDIPCSLETFKQDGILFGRGAVILPLDREDTKSFLSFSPKFLRDDHGANVRASRKRSNGIVIFESVMPEWKKRANWRHDFTGRISIELYKRWPPLASDYEEREDFFGSIVLSIHSEGVDPKCFFTFSSGLSSADHNPHSPAADNGVREPLMTTNTISLETVDHAGTSVGKNPPRSSHAGSVKRKQSHDGIQSELRRSERLAKRART